MGRGSEVWLQFIAKKKWGGHGRPGRPYAAAPEYYIDVQVYSAKLRKFTNVLNVQRMLCLKLSTQRSQLSTRNVTSTTYTVLLVCGICQPVHLSSYHYICRNSTRSPSNLLWCFKFALSMLMNHSNNKNSMTVVNGFYIRQ